MPISYSPTEAPANRDSVTGPVVDGADPDNASTFNQVFQPIWNLLERVKKKAAFLDLASTFSTLQTFSAGLAGTTAALTGNATVGGTLGVTGATTVGSLASSGAVSGTSLDIGSGAASISSAGYASFDTVNAENATATTMTAEVIVVDAPVYVGVGGAPAFSSGFGTVLNDVANTTLHYRHLPTGEVEVAGTVTRAAPGDDIAFTLPLGFRPEGMRYFAAFNTVATNSLVFVRIAPDGSVVVIAPNSSTTQVSCRFFAVI